MSVPGCGQDLRGRVRPTNESIIKNGTRVKDSPPGLRGVMFTPVNLGTFNFLERGHSEVKEEVGSRFRVCFEFKPIQGRDAGAKGVDFYFC